MLTTHAYTAAFIGIEAREVDVQCQLSSGLPAFNVVGLPDKAIAESKERVRAALNSIGLALPAKRITVNLAPADLQKAGSHYDLPIALALLSAMEVIPADEPSHFVTLGELSLDGTLNSVLGAMPAALMAAESDRGVICPAQCGAEASWVGSVSVLAPATLLELINHMNGRQALAPPKAGEAKLAGDIPDLRDVKGQESARRALEITAAGGHNMLMIGPPGAGKSMLAARMPGILPPLTAEEALETSLIHSLAGLLEDGRVSMTRPYRAPHHSASMPAMVGGGKNAAPGEVSLAHNGVLFLDELPEFARPVLEALRQPIETGETVIARANAHARYPSRVQLVAAMNPCKCGHLGDPSQCCSRAPGCGLDYQARISGPMIDRIDVQIELQAVTPADLALPPASEDSATVRARIARVRELQAERYAPLGKAGVRLNAHADGEILERVASLTAPAKTLLLKVCESLRLSARGYHRVIRLARTIADIENDTEITETHIAEAASYRRAPLIR